MGWSRPVRSKDGKSSRPATSGCPKIRWRIHLRGLFGPLAPWPIPDRHPCIVLCPVNATLRVGCSDEPNKDGTEHRVVQLVSEHPTEERIFPVGDGKTASPAP